MEFEQSLIEDCQCTRKFSIEAHGTAYVLYFGRCGHRHGYNLATISDCSHNCDLEYIEQLLNRQGD